MSNSNLTLIVCILQLRKSGVLGHGQNYLFILPLFSRYTLLLWDCIIRNNNSDNVACDNLFIPSIHPSDLASH